MADFANERCQVPSCPLTGGWENINHVVKPGCIRHNQAPTFNTNVPLNENILLTSTLKFPKPKQWHC